MKSWKSHVRAELFLRDCRQRDPFSGLFDKVSRLEEMLAFHMKLWQDMDACSSKEKGSSRCPDEGSTLSLRVSELEFLNQQARVISRTINITQTGNLRSDQQYIYLKEAELQYCHSQVARYRTEAVVLAKGAFCLKASVEEYEYQLECQSKELTALRLEHSSLREELTASNLQNEQLLKRWLEEKKEEAERINKYNAIQERWQCLAGRLKKRSSVRSRAANSSSEINPIERPPS